MLAAPASLACRKVCTLRTQETTGQPKQPAFPAQWPYGLYVVSSVSGLVSHRRLAFVTQNLIPASGNRDRTISPSATCVSSLRTSRPSHPAPHQVTIGHDAPLAGRDGRNIRLISYSEKANYFRQQGLNAANILGKHAKLVFARTSQEGLSEANPMLRDRQRWVSRPLNSSYAG